jgi:hypothetical protein
MRATGTGVALVLVVLGTATRVPAAEIRVLSTPGAATTVSIAATPSVTIEDRTPGAKPATATGGPASSGETFTGELTLLLRGFSLARPAAIDVSDPLVTSVRLFPEPDGATVTVFVRQPVTYTVARPTGAGDVRIELHGKTRGLTLTGATPAVRASRPSSRPASTRPPSTRSRSRTIARPTRSRPAAASRSRAATAR